MYCLGSEDFLIQTEKYFLREKQKTLNPKALTHWSEQDFPPIRI